jgi:peptidoglycan/LPS O-acetylase OafA/YrhL
MRTTGESFRSSAASVHLDLIRGLAALVVLVGHLRGVFFVDFRQVEAPTFLVHLFYFLSGFGHQAVMVFFVLSGYFISTSIFQSCSNNRWRWSTYMINRVSRLHVVLVPGLLWTMGLDYLGMSLFPSHGVYDGSLAPHVVPDDVGVRYGIGIFLDNVACLQNIVVPPLGSNGALWSLSNEFWYYVIFPLLAVPLCLSIRRVRGLMSILAGAVLLTLVGEDHAFYFLIWLMGTGIGLLSNKLRSRTASRSLLIGGVLLFSGTLLLERSGFVSNSRISDLLVGLSFAVLLLTLVHCEGPCRSEWYRKVASGLAGFSYSLYVFHLPVLVFLAACALGSSRWQPTLPHLALALAVLVFVTVITFLLSRVTEAHTEAVRRFLSAPTRIAEALVRARWFARPAASSTDVGDSQPAALVNEGTSR